MSLVKCYPRWSKVTNIVHKQIYNAFHLSYLKSYQSGTKARKFFGIREQKMDSQYKKGGIGRLDYSASFDSRIYIQLVSPCVFTTIRVFASSVTQSKLVRIRNCSSKVDTSVVLGSCSIYGKSIHISRGYFPLFRLTLLSKSQL